MTRMSDHPRAPTRDHQRKPVTFRTTPPVACTVHAPGPVVRVVMLMIGLSAGLGACVVPPSLQLEKQDAGVNSPPAITDVRFDGSATAEPGPVEVETGRGALSAKLIDTDLSDTLYLRVFVDYTVSSPTPARSQCKAPSDTGLVERKVTCDLSALCVSGDVNKDFDMSVVVFDREPQDTGTPFFQAMEPGGLKTSWFYHLKCVPQQSTGAQ